MKHVLLFILCVIFIHKITAQNWIPKGEEVLPEGYAVMSMSLVGDSVIWMTASSFAATYAQEPVPPLHLIRVMRSVDAGESWEALSVVESFGRISFDIVGISADTAWITTQDFGSGRGRALMKTEDGGETWKQKFLHQAAGVYLRAFDDQNLFCHSNKFVATSEDGGESWSIDTLLFYGPDEFNSLISGVNMACAIGDTVWVGTTLGRVFRSTDYGTSHSIALAAPTGNFIQCVSFEDHLRGMLLYYSNDFTKYGLMRTFDGGSTWEHTPKRPIDDLSGNLTHVTGAPGSYIITPEPYSTDRYYFYTTDFGESWTYGGNIFGAGCNAVQFLSPEIGWVSAGYFDYEEVRHVGFKWSGDIFTGTNNKYDSITGFEISPNPANSRIHYQFDNDINTHEQTVMDLYGHILKSEITSSTEVDISSLPVGTYFLRIKAGDKLGAHVCEGLRIVTTISKLF